MADKRASSELPLDLPDLPPGWSYKPLGTLVDDRGISYGIVQPGKHEPDGIPIIRVNNIKNGHISGDDALRVSTDIEASYERTRLRGGEVLLTLVGSLGEAGIVPPQYAGWNVARAVGVIPVEPDPGCRWVALCLRSQLAQRHIQMWATTTVQATFNLRDVARLPIPIPPKREREAIAHILGTLDDKIELNRRMNETLEAMARAIFKSWFVDFDPVRAKCGTGILPVNAKDKHGQDGRATLPGLPKPIADLFPDSFEDSVLGEIPKGWEVMKLADVCSTQYGYTASAVDEPVGPKFLRVTDINKRNWIEWDDVPHCAIESDVRASYGLHVGDLVVARMADPGKSAIIEEEIDAVFASYLVRLKTPSVAHGYYVYGFLKSDAYTEYAEGAKSGSVQANMNAKVIVGTCLAVPPKAVLEQFLSAILPLRQRLVANVHESRTLAAIRDALLPKLLSGELRVAEAEQFVERNA